MKTSTKLLSMFSAFCAFLFIGMTANAQSITVIPGLTATQMAQELVGSNVTVSNATYTGSGTASGSFNQASSTFPLTDGIILTSGNATNALGPNNTTGLTGVNNTPGDADLTALIGGVNTFDAAVLEFDIVSNCNTVTFDYIFASEEYPEYACSQFNDAFAFLITGPGYAPNTNIALVPGTTIPVSINNVVNAPGNNPPCVSNPSYYVDNGAGTSVQYDGFTVVLTATATIQPCQTYHVKIVVADAADAQLDSAIFLKGGGINCATPGLATAANITAVECGALGSIDLSVNSGTGPFTYSWTGPGGFTATTEDITGLAVGDYTVDIVGSDCLSSGQATFTVTENVDVVAPVFVSCPSNIIIDAANNGCAFLVNPPLPPTVTDDCGVTSLTTSVDLATYQFGAGTTTVTYTATDAAGNTATCDFDVIINPAPLEVTLIPHVFNGGPNIKCYGESSGFLDSAYATGGCCPYTYKWVHPQFGPQQVVVTNCTDVLTAFNTPGLGLQPVGGFPWGGATPPFGFPAGAFEMTVVDGNNDSIVETITLIENPPVTATAVWAPIQCYGGTTDVTLDVQAGAAPYNGFFQYNNVLAGPYNYIVSDANGCRAYDTILITQPDILDAIAIPEAVLCNGDTTSVALNVTGGTMPYMTMETVVATGGTTTSPGTGPFDAIAGSYEYDITDANGCTENVQLAINEPGPLVLGISNTSIPCYGGTSIVTVTAFSATEPYFGTGDFVEYAGWHQYPVEDINGCVDTIGMFVTQPSLMVSSVTATPILCAGDSSTITVTGTGGTGAWSGTGTFIEPAGIYGYSFSDANGCTDTNSITITQPTQLTMNLSSTGIACFGDMATVIVTASGGMAPYTGTGSFTAGNGTTVFTVTDANGCTISDSISLVEPAQMVAFASCPAPPACFGDSATIAVTAFGGTLPYTDDGVYLAGNGSTTYVVTDANGCTASVTHTVTAPAPLVISISSTGIDCNGGTADITVTGTGGTAPYTGGGTSTVSAGTHTFTLTDANGCTTDTTITVTEPAALVASISATTIDCNGGTADITVTATGGTAPYTNTGTFNVMAGTYDYIVTDANGCSDTVSITVTEPAALVASISATTIDCNGGTADITVTATGGTAPYTNTGTFNVMAGTYDYIVTDANGCSDTVSITVTEPAALVASISATTIDCNGGTADITVTATGGTAPYTNTGTFNVMAGTYDYIVTDANGCSDTVSITVTEPAALVASISATTILCNGGTADVTVTAVGGTAPLSGVGTFSVAAGTHDFVVTDANGCSTTVSITVTEHAPLQAFSSCPVPVACAGDSATIAVTAFGGTPSYSGTGLFNLPAGTYDFVVVDANGCTDTTTHVISEPTPLVVTATSTSIDCNGGTADVTVTATGGTPSYTGTGTFTGLSAGTYNYTVTDANGCTEIVSVTITEPAPLVATATAPGILCNGGSTDVTVSATGGTAPYTNTGIFSQTVGTYTYIVTDANGCSDTVSITLTEPTELMAFVSCPVIDCNGGTADMAVFAFGGTAPYTNTGIFNVAAGNYTYVVTDANGCTDTVSHTVTEPAPIVVTITSTGIDCNGGTADVTVTATGGTPSYMGTGTFTGLSAGTYNYTITDANGCTETASITISEPTPLVASASAGTILCNGGSADVVITATGGTAPYTGTTTMSQSAGTVTYTVTDANGCTATTTVTLTEPALLQAFASCPAILCNGGTTDIGVTAFGGTPPYTGDIGVFNVTAGTYTYSITDANGCTASVTHTVTEPAPLVVTVTSTSIDCNGGTADVTVTATGGTAGYSGTGTFTGLSSGTYNYTVTDANGCTETVSITLTEPTALSASISATPILCNGGTSDVTVTATGGTAPYTNTGVTTVSAGTQTITVTDANGCSTTVSITITEPAALVASASATTIDCNGGTADVTVTATGGTAPLTGTGTFTVGGGMFNYTVTDANGCTSTVSITVVEPAALTATATVGAFDCSTLTADVTITATGGTAPYTNTGTVTQSEGTTTYTVVDANGCSVSVDATVQAQNFVDLTCPGDQIYPCNYSQSCGSQNTGSLVSWDEPTASSFGTCGSGCGPNTAIPGFIYMGEYNGSRYYCSSTSNYSWQAANLAAINAGGHLATIESAGENQFIYSQVMANVAWIGYTDQAVEGTFEWVTGENVTYENWAGSDPNNDGPLANNCGYCGEADYTVISSSHGGWYDRYECNLNEFVMEIPCGNPITIVQTSGPTNGSFITGGNSDVVTYVATDNVTGATATCSFTVQVEKCTPNYCESEGYCTAYEWIDQVSLGSINNQSGNDSGYGDYTTLATGASVGDVVNLTLTPGFSGQSYTEAWRVWIDWNYDGDFYDQGEMVYEGYGTSALSGSFTVPAFATVNEDLRVRVSMRWNCYPGPCSTFQYGEVEDYTIFIQDGGGIGGLTTVIGEAGKGSETNTGAQDNIKSYDDVADDTSVGGIGLEIGNIYPNPVLATSGEFNLELRVGNKSDVTVRIVDLSGKVMMTEFMLLETGANKRMMDVTGFARGSYIIEVVSGDLKETTQLIVQ